MFGIVLPLDFILSFLLYITGKPEKSDQLCCNNSALIEILERNGTNIEPILLAQKGVSLTLFRREIIDLTDSSSMYVSMFGNEATFKIWNSDTGQS